MPAWDIGLADEVGSAVRGDLLWEGYLRQLASPKQARFALHLAIFVEPYLQFILEGRKTVESRFSVRRGVPYKCVQKGDVVLLKRSGGPIVGLCRIADAWFYRLDPRSWDTIRKEFTEALCAQDPGFWNKRKHASFATLMRLQHVRSIAPIRCAKRDRRGWVVLQRSLAQLPLLDPVKPLVVAFAGRMGSGKSTLSMGIAKALRWPWVSFGDYIRHVARSRGLDCSRETLQYVGSTLIDQGWEGFCRAVLMQVNWEPGQPLVIDGIRHAEAVAALRQLVTPSKLVLVFITVNDPVREARLRQRGVIDREQLRRAEEHPIEVQVGTVLPEMADLTVDGARPVEDLLQETVSWIRQHEVVVTNHVVDKL